LFNKVENKVNIYLDNAATTPIDPLVYEAMQPYFTRYFGNPSSIHANGRAVRTAIETARKTIAEILSVTPAEIVFTSGGTEADNTFITGALLANEITSIITSKIEHPAVLQTINSLENSRAIKVSYVTLNDQGGIDLNHLEELLREQPKSLVTLMHANNEIGNLTDLAMVSEISQKFGAVLHSDTVQTMGHLDLNLATLKLDGLSASAHKFHGPKGIGFMYVRKGVKIPQLITGGNQERSHRVEPRMSMVLLAWPKP
jgi:cysteine desulfurase